jgi:hypothetical protein
MIRLCGSPRVCNRLLQSLLTVGLEARLPLGRFFKADIMLFLYFSISWDSLALAAAVSWNDLVIAAMASALASATSCSDFSVASAVSWDNLMLAAFSWDNSVLF